MGILHDSENLYMETAGCGSRFMNGKERPKLSAPIITMGKVTTNLAVFDTLGEAVDMVFGVEKEATLQQ